ncbi:MAG: bifunctional DNA-binding transcriptional regulator/O6-methylguanine-DNA methyltransferase Ada [Terriglobales bacterium]
MASTIMTSEMADMAVSREHSILWQAVLARDARRDGTFFFAVKSTGIYCRPSCAARRPRRENVVFFRQPEEAEHAGFRPCQRCRPRAAADHHSQAGMARAVCRYIESHLDEPITLARLARVFRKSPFHLQRTFKAAVGITPREYADSRRMERFKGELKAGRSVTHALYDAGYSSSSRLYERAGAELGMTPDAYRRGAIGMDIHYTIAESPIGRMLVGATRKGVCLVRFGDSDEELEAGLRREYPYAVKKRDDEALLSWRNALLEHLRGHTPDARLPLDIRATAFQKRVWNYLQQIPRGGTRSYSDVARAIGRPQAVRAVARACATNPVSIAIPCHRVIGSDGSLTGYAWGIEKKKKLLEMEKKPVK